MNREIANVVLAGYFPFPSGSAAAARLRNLALGLNHAGVQVRVLSMAPMYEREISSNNRIENTTYENTALFDLAESATAVKSRALQQIKWFVSLYGATIPTYRKLKALLDRDECDLFISYGRNAAVIMPLLRLVKRHDRPAILDVTELAKQFSGRGGKLNPIYWDWKAGESYMPAQFDGVVAITHCLEQHLREKGCKKTFVMPAIDAWNGSAQSAPAAHAESFRLLTVSSLIDRDAPDQLIQLLESLASKRVPFSLELVGRYEANPARASVATKLRQNSVLQPHIRFRGELTDAELHKLMTEVDGLLLTRRNLDTERCSFPTRLVEFLKQGKPVFVADVGDISTYLRDGVDVFMFPPDDPAQGAEIIEAVINSPDRGRTVGIAGRLRGRECFDRTIHAKRLLAFAQALRSTDTE